MAGQPEYRAPVGTHVGHVHLKVADLERSVAFYEGILGFTVQARMGTRAAFLGARLPQADDVSGGDAVYHHHIGLNTWESQDGSGPAPGTTGLYHSAFLYPDRAALAQAVRHVLAQGWPLTGASDHGVSEAVYLDDPDGNGVELYRDRPLQEWPRNAQGALEMSIQRLDLDALLLEA